MCPPFHISILFDIIGVAGYVKGFGGRQHGGDGHVFVAGEASQRNGCG
jgi:hypothetical protein